MSKIINLIFGVHNHQPVGNFDSVFEESFEKAYKPFIDILSKFPEIKLSYHISGALLKWLIAKKPEFIDRLKNMVKTGQIEIIAGGFYEPILPIIPDRDKLNQIKTYIEFLNSVFEVKPTGFWLAERVWEPHLAKSIGEAGCRYTIVDDYHFRSAGLSEADLYGYFMTDEQNVPISVFPISEKLRYYVPFRMPKDTIDFLKTLATEDGKRVITIVDDGEKFGVWPKTYEWVYEGQAPSPGGWLKNFFDELQENRDIIKTKTFSEVLENIPPSGRFYIPTASYEEMMEWSLLPDATAEYQKFIKDLKESGKFEIFSKFVKGGFWRNFLFKYPESNNMQKKMFYVSNKVNYIKDYDKKLEASDELFQGQCNCAYWHGIFGGLYLKHLRNAVYNHLLKAEKIADSDSNSQKEWIKVEEIDFDLDGNDEILISSDSLNVYFNKNYGGSIFELDFKDKCINLLDTLSRRKENYHTQIEKFHRNSKELHQNNDKDTKSIHDLPLEFSREDIDKALKYDWYRRVSLLDHFFGEYTTIEKFRYVVYPELGDFVKQPYKAQVTSYKNRVSVELTRDGALWKNGSRFPIKITKKLNLFEGSNKLNISYDIENKFKDNLDLWFGVEFNVSLPSTENKVESRNTDTIILSDKFAGFEVKFSSKIEASVWHFPVETVSQAIGKLEKVYQSSVVVFHWKFMLTPGEIWHVDLTEEISSL